MTKDINEAKVEESVVTETARVEYTPEQWAEIFTNMMPQIEADVAACNAMAERGDKITVINGHDFS